MKKSNEQLMADYQKGDILALEYLFENNKVRIFRFCYGLLNNRADAEEIAGEVFLTLILKKETYDTERTFSTWLFTIARNKCFSYMRTRKHSVSLGVTAQGEDRHGSWDVEDEGENSRESFAKKERALQVQKAIAGLPFEQKEAMELRQYQKFSYVDISQILDCSLEKVKILIFRAKENLRVKLASYIGEERS